MKDLKNKFNKILLALSAFIFAGSVFVFAGKNDRKPNLGEAYRRDFKGEGRVIAIIDTGADINHGDFKITDESYVKLKEEDVNKLIGKYGLKGKYVSPKIPYIRDYYGADNDIFSRDEHGMHVAGIAGANGNVKGVAPEAQLLLMKVFPDDGLNEDLDSEAYYVEAMRDAIKLGADVINLSLGTGAGTEKFVGQAVKDVIKEARAAGIVVNVAAGNNGYFGFNQAYPKAENPDYGVIAMPALLEDVVGVGSVEGERISSTNILVDGKYYPYQIARADSLSYYDPMPYGSDIELVNVGFGTDGEYKDLDVEGKIVIAMRGKKSFRQLQNIARKNNARGIIIYNNEKNPDELFELDGAEFSLPVAVMRYKDGLAISDKKYINILKDPIDRDNENFGKLSKFSPWGLSNEGRLKPDLLAPGGSILSLDNHNDYKRMSGTSMATPYISGVSALIKQRLVETYPKKLEGLELSNMISRILISSARPMEEDGQLISSRKQGSGLVDIKGAVSAQVIAYMSEDAVNLNLGNVDNFIELKLVLENISNKSLELTGKYRLLVDRVKDGRFTMTSNVVKEGGVEKLVLGAFEKKTLAYKIDISDIDLSQYMKNGYFIDGFLTFDYGQDKSGVGVSFTSFKGDFEALDCLEKPVYEKNPEDLTYYDKGSNENDFTHLASSIKVNGEEVAVVLGENTDKRGENRSFDSSHIAISPNEDHNYESMDFIFTILRSFEKINIDILDDKGKLIDSYSASHRIEFLKSYYGSDGRNKKSMPVWTYVPKKGISDGKYRAEISIERFGGQSKKEISYDFYIDTKPPKLDSYEIVDKKLQLKCRDELSGIKLVQVTKNGKNLKMEADGSYKINQDDIKGLSVILVDWAGNVFGGALK